MSNTTRKCVFIDRSCSVDTDEIPLEVCRLCLDAWKFMLTQANVRRTLGTTVEHGLAASKPPKQAIIAAPSGTQSLWESLAELDKMFAEGELDINEYIRRRKEIVGSSYRLGSPSSPIKGPLPEAASIGLIVLSRGKIELKYPKDFSLPEGFKGAAKQVYELLKVFKENFELSTPTFNVQCLDMMGEKAILIFTAPHLRLEEYAISAETLRSILREAGSISEALPKIYEKIIERLSQLIVG